MRFTKSFAPTAAFTIAAALLLGASSPRRSTLPDSSHAVTLVHIDSLVVTGVSLDATGLVGRVLIYADGPARAGIGSTPLKALADTIRLRSLPGFTVDVSQSAVHVELVGGQLPRGGSLAIAGSVTGGSATRVAGVGRHLLILQGGAGIQVLDPAGR